MGGDYEKLVTYRMAAELGDLTWGAIGEWPEFARWTIGKQLARAADSIGANIAEGAGRRSDRDRARFYLIARGSLYETEHWLARARARGFDVPDLRTDELGRALAGLIADTTRT